MTFITMDLLLLTALVCTAWCGDFVLLILIIGLLLSVTLTACFNCFWFVVDTDLLICGLFTVFLNYWWFILLFWSCLWFVCMFACFLRCCSWLVLVWLLGLVGVRLLHLWFHEVLWCLVRLVVGYRWFTFG